LLAQLRQHERILQAWQEADLGLATDLAAVTALANSLIAPCLSTPAAAVITALAWQNLSTDDGEFNEALLNLSQLARRQPETRAYLDEAIQGVSHRPLPAEFQTALADFLARFGHRAAYEADIASPRYVDDPRPILQIIRQYLQADPPASAPSGQSRLSWGSLIRQSKGIQRWLPWRYGLAVLLVKRLRRLLVMRDTLNRTRTEAIAACRRWHLALAQRWVEGGWLAQADDIFWLTHDEVERALMFDTEAGPTLSATVGARRATYQTYADTPMPFSLLESQIPFIELGFGLSTTSPTDVLVGLPISPGQTRGTVLVLRRPDEFERIADDLILVLPSTDPAWLPLLRLASGLVVEMGGLLSHGSVIAREYSLPAVANIVNATQILHTGDVVLVDGSTGVVQLLQSAQQAAG
jgi:pyruvate,water dikinase